MSRTKRNGRRYINARLRVPLAVAAILALVASGCGARLTKAQMDALNGNSGTGGVALGSSGGSGGTTAGSGSGSTAAASPGASSGAATASGVPVAGSAGAGATTSHSGASGAAVASGASHGAGGSTTVTQAGNPLAGPGGKVCVSGAPGSGPGVTASTITVGNIATVNGPVPGLFAGARYGAQAVSDYINSMGGICGRKLVVNSADDQFDQATDQQEASTMSNSVLAFMGSFSLQDGGIPAGAPNVPDIGEALASSRFNSPYNFSPQPEAPGYNEGEYLYLKSLPQYANATQHMAMLVENTPQTATTGKEEQGYKFVFVDTTLQPTDPTFNGDVQKMKSAGVQGVIFQATGTIIGQLANAMYAAGMKVVLGNYSPPAYDPAFIQNAGPGTAGTLLSQSLALYDGEDAATIPMVATLDQWYSRVDPGQVPDIYAVYSWMSGLMLAQALNESGSVTRAALMAGLKTLTSFTGDGLGAPSNPVAKTPPTCYLFITVQNGKFVRAPQSPSGFVCSPAAYYHYNG
jgi:ABC-type branched-subunit amino acid transport system substrate-binding protein